jgi:hypothetical protein
MTNFNINEARKEFANANIVKDEQEFDFQSNKHPDQRAIPCPSNLIFESEIIERYGNGYHLMDGSYFDPIDGNFYKIITLIE